MKTFRLLSAVVGMFLGLALLHPGAIVHAQSTTSTYTPKSGQEGKDVVWVPTPQILIDRMLEMAKVTPEDSLVDLGSGDGRTVITAAKRGVRARGIEFNPDLVALSKSAAKREGVGDKATFVQGDIFQSNFSDATVVTLFLLPRLNLRLRPTLLDMKPGTRVVSNTFDMDDWEPEDRVEGGGNCTTFCRAFMWIIPAKVQGTWQLPRGHLALKQKYQMVSGTMTLDGKKSELSGKLVGDSITLSAGGQTLTGKVNGSTIEGTSQAMGQWTATRVRS